MAEYFDGDQVGGALYGHSKDLVVTLHDLETALDNAIEKMMDKGPGSPWGNGQKQVGLPQFGSYAGAGLDLYCAPIAERVA